VNLLHHLVPRLGTKMRRRCVLYRTYNEEWLLVHYCTLKSRYNMLLRGLLQINIILPFMAGSVIVQIK